jgi:hypothetical protein
MGIPKKLKPGLWAITVFSSERRRTTGRARAVLTAELAVAVGVGGAFFHLGRRLQQVAQPLEDPPHGVVRHLEALADQVAGQWAVDFDVQLSNDADCLESQD